MNSKQRLSFVGTAVIGIAAVVAALLWSRGAPAPTEELPARSPLALDRLPATGVSEISAQGSEFQHRAHNALLDAGFSPASADGAAVALEEYLHGTSSHDIDALAALARTHGAEVDPILLESVKRMLQVIPEHAKPAGSADWDDIDILRNTQYKTKYRLWDSVAAERVEVVRFQGADVLVDEMKFYRIGPQTGGGQASIHAAPFRVRDLERRLQQGDAAGAVVTFPVMDDNGRKQSISVLLGEYAPGKWYPVRHKTTTFGG